MSRGVKAGQMIKGRQGGYEKAGKGDANGAGAARQRHALLPGYCKLCDLVQRKRGRQPVYQAEKRIKGSVLS